METQYKVGSADNDVNVISNLDLELEHSEERLNLSGLYQAAPRAAIQQLAGFMLPIAGGNSQLVFTAEKPDVPPALADVLYFEIHPVERGDFEEFLGTTVEKARRVAAAPMPELDRLAEAGQPPAEPKPEPEPVKPPRKQEDKPKSPPLGGRR